MTVSLQVNDRSDLELLLLIANRLGLRILNKQELMEKKEGQLKKDLQIIQAGVNLPNERLNAMLQSVEENRAE